MSTGLEDDEIRAVAPGLPEVRRAAARLAGVVRRTEVVNSSSLDHQLGARILFKCENLQKVGAFKARGAANAVASLDDETAARGVLTHSSGNHGAALAWAARRRGIPATVVVPEGASGFKLAAIERYGANLVRCEATQQAREQTSLRLAQETGAELILPFDDARVIAGQGTAALEFLQDHPEIELLLAPVGGGGLLAGTALAAGAIHPSPLVWGAEPAAVDDAARSLAAGQRLANEGSTTTIADGLRTSIGVLNWEILRSGVAGIAVVQEDEIVAAMRLVWERLKLVIEPSAAVPVAALLAHRVPLAGRTVGVILSGGNLDLERLPW